MIRQLSKNILLLSRFYPALSAVKKISFADFASTVFNLLKLVSDRYSLPIAGTKRRGGKAD
jgi:hypothetical protein